MKYLTFIIFIFLLSNSIFSEFKYLLGSEEYLLNVSHQIYVNDTHSKGGYVHMHDITQYECPIIFSNALNSFALKIDTDLIRYLQNNIDPSTLIDSIDSIDDISEPTGDTQVYLDTK
jgi:hypothetical protein